MPVDMFLFIINISKKGFVKITAQQRSAFDTFE
jgi:hypothetical protein